jgi:hypothetical protein
MPLGNEAIFDERFTLRMGRVLTRLALHDGHDAIAADLNRAAGYEVTRDP